jgi:nucleoid-associated protein YgaU
MKRLFSFLAVATFVAAITGCSVNTKLIERERVDQGVIGNRGYLQGAPPAESERKATRKYYEVQVEFPSVTEESRVSKKAPQEVTIPAPAVKYKSPAGKAVTESAVEEEARITTVEIEEIEKEEAFTDYTVQNGDTLQKISMKFFGTTKKWKKIFNANQDVLKTPDKVRPGMVLKIPALESIKVIESEYIK